MNHARALVSLLALASTALGLESSAERFSGRLRQGVDHIRNMEYAEAIGILEDLAAEFPDSPLPEYNIACAHALCRRTEQSLDHLAAAVTKGYRNVSAMQLDADLRSIHGTERYVQIEKDARSAFLRSIRYHVQAPRSYDPTKTYGLLLHMGGAGSDGSDWLPFWEALKDRKPLSDTVVVSIQYLSGDADGI